MLCIDHSLLRPELTGDDVEAGLELAARMQVATACVRPCDVTTAVRTLAVSGVGTSVAIGFPHGGHLAATKVDEAGRAVEQGAAELDMVVNIGAVRGNDWEAVADEVQAVVQVAAPMAVKCILETAYLTPQQVIRASQVVADAGAAFVKNGTGFSPRGADVLEIALMRQVVGNAVGVKAAGGVRSLDAMLAVLDAGANRIGATATQSIADEWMKRQEETLS
jgi:deoxyribose-phosphate aldolase